MRKLKLKKKSGQRLPINIFIYLCVAAKTPSNFVKQRPLTPFFPSLSVYFLSNIYIYIYSRNKDRKCCPYSSLRATERDPLSFSRNFSIVGGGSGTTFLHMRKFPFPLISPKQSLSFARGLLISLFFEPFGPLVLQA